MVTAAEAEERHGESRDRPPGSELRHLPRRTAAPRSVPRNRAPPRRWDVNTRVLLLPRWLVARACARFGPSTSFGGDLGAGSRRRAFSPVMSRRVECVELGRCSASPAAAPEI